MSLSIARHICWLLLLVGYTAYKYLLGLQNWNFGYALQVGVIVLLTAIVPYYLTLWSSPMLRRPLRLFYLALLPTAAAVLGFGMFYLAFIRTNFPEVTALQVMPRGLLPGLCISAILLTFEWLGVNESPAAVSGSPTSSSRDS